MESNIAARTLKDVRSRKVRMYLKEVTTIHQLKEELARHTDEAKRRRATLTGKEWGEAQREAAHFDIAGSLC